MFFSHVPFFKVALSLSLLNVEGAWEALYKTFLLIKQAESICLVVISENSLNSYKTKHKCTAAATVSVC